MSNVSFSFGTNLSADFVAGNGVYVYATVFAGGTNVQTYNLVNNGTVSGSLTNLALPSSLVSGNIVITMQETAGTSIAPFNPTSLAFNQVASASVAATNNYRYDTVELTLTNASGDAADLTNIVQFGMPIALSANGSTRGFLPNVGGAPTGQALVTAMDGISPAGFQNGTWAAGSTPLASPADQRETYMGGNNGNSTTNTNLLNQSTDWNAYVQALGQVDQHIRIANFFPGVAASGTTPAVSPYFVYYDVSYDGHTVTMNPINDANYDALLQSSGVQAMGSAIKVAATSSDQGYGTGNALTENIYMQAGNITILPDPGNPAGSYTQLYAANNQYAAPVKFLLSGFEAGFWGGQALSIPDAVAGNTGAAHLDLNKSWNWSALYAYQAVGTANGALANFDYSNTISGARVDPYAAQVFQTSNAYGWSFSDFIASLGGVTNPTLNLWTGSADADISITLFGLTDTPTGYLQQALNTMSATGAMAATMVPSTGGFNQFIINTQVGIPGTTMNVAPVDGTPMIFRFYSPYDPTHGADGFVDMPLPNDYDQSLQAVNTGGHWTWQQNGSSGLTGKILITSAPVTGDGSVGWYQLVVGTGSYAKTYNFYTTQGGTPSGVFTNVVSDGGASSLLTPGTPQIAVINLSSGGSITYAPDYWLSATPQNGPPPLPAPTAPPQKLTPVLVGDNDGGTFDALTVLAQANLAFSFNAAGDNDTGGFNIAKIVLADVAHPSWTLTPVIVQSDLYGRWSTPEITEFWDGTYTAYMEQYKPANWALDRPVGYATIPVTFTVQLDKLPFTATPDSHALQLSAEAGSATKGNWIELSAVASTLPNGTLVVYATDSAGNMLARDGHTITTSLEAAALGRIGSVASDNGTVFFSGEQHVYLQAGQQLHFAVVARDGTIDTNPTVNVSGSGSSLAVNVSDAFGAINLVAKVNNALDQSDVLAASQRGTDHPWIYLKQGAQVGVDLAWSADNTNTLHFVRLDVNPVDATKWKVGGVDYGNTDAFRAAVQNNWEFASTQGHSTGTSQGTWTVRGADGYYAPVLVNQQGEIFIVDQSSSNTANADGHQHIRNFGQNTFGFEDLSAGHGSDFDYNDMVMQLWLR